jgi:hypothetical protein
MEINKQIAHELGEVIKNMPDEALNEFIITCTTNVVRATRMRELASDERTNRALREMEQ